MVARKNGILSRIASTAGIVRPFSTASWRARVEKAVAAMAAQGEKTLVLSTGGRTEEGARRLLPQLPEVCFVAAGDFTDAALRRAVEHGVPQVVLVGMAGRLAELAAADAGRLAEITTAMGGSEELAARVAEAPRRAYELWEADGLLGRAGRELCRRVAGVLEGLTDGKVAAQVVLVDVTGRRMVAMYGRLGR
jgi:cobalt-precorrin-5B (C1)-methyltransferase